MSRAPWFKLWASDFLADNYVDAMTAEQLGWYTILLVRSWNNTPQGYLANDKQLLSKWCRDADPMSFALRANIVLERFETTEDGRFIYHPKLVEQAGRLAQTAEKRADAGRKGGKNRSKQKPSNCLANAKQMPTDSESDSDITPLPPSGVSPAAKETKTQPKLDLTSAWPYAEAVAIDIGLSGRVKESVCEQIALVAAKFNLPHEQVADRMRAEYSAFASGKRGHLGPTMFFQDYAAKWGKPKGKATPVNPNDLLPAQLRERMS